VSHKGRQAPGEDERQPHEKGGEKKLGKDRGGFPGKKKERGFQLVYHSTLVSWRGMNVSA